MKMYGELDVQIHVFWTSALAGGEWSASRPGHFTPKETPTYPFSMRLGEPQNRSERCVEEKDKFASTGSRTPTPRPSRPAIPSYENSS
jgi:hypothetical protein